MKTPPPVPQVTYQIISSDAALQRLDNYLFRTLKGVPNTCIYRMIRRGEVRINGGRVDAKYRLCAGDKVRIPPVRMGEPSAPLTTLREPVKAALSATLLAEAGDYLILNKPAGLAVHGGSGIRHGLIEQWRCLRPDAACLELVHRLDRDTSGILVLAQKRSALRTLQAAWTTDQVQKQYVALLEGRWQGPARVCAPLRKQQHVGGERITQVDVAGKESTTLFEVIQYFEGATLVRATLVTGRMHQIRVHSAYLGHPIAGDEKYGNRSFNQQMKAMGLRRLFLHAQRLCWKEAGWDWEAPLPDELTQVLQGLSPL